MGWLKALIVWIESFVESLPVEEDTAPDTLPEPENAPQSLPIIKPIEIPVMPTIPSPDSIVYDWDTQKHYFHNVRVLCDLAGLTLLQKNIVCACIYVESQFRDYKSNGTPVQNWNKNEDGSIWSTDWGLVQINDWPKFKHIGVGCMFSSVEDVLTHPERSSQYMINTMKETGELQPWASYTSGVYKQHLLDSSPMWLLKS